MAKSVDSDKMLHSVASHLGLHCLLRPVCSITKIWYSNFRTDIPEQTEQAIHSLPFYNYISDKAGGKTDLFEFSDRVRGKRV